MRCISRSTTSSNDASRSVRRRLSVRLRAQHYGGRPGQSCAGILPSDPAARVGYAPAPGVQRVMHAGRTVELLTRLDFKGEMPADDVCFARPAAPFSSHFVTAAMQKTLGAEAHIEILEVSKFPAPEGELIFPAGESGSPSGCFLARIRAL